MTKEPTTEDRLRDLEGAARVLHELQTVDPKEPPDFAGDKVGVGRYILSFFLAGFIGVWVAYWARYYGWRAIWINLAIFMTAIIVLANLGAFDQEGACYQFADGSVYCD